MRNKGFTLIEILVSAVILALVMTGLANIFIAGKRHILHSRSRMTSGELARFFLDPIQMQVRQDQWATNCLGTGNPVNCPSQIQTIDGTTYTANWSVTNAPATLRKVIANITWTEVQP